MTDCGTVIRTAALIVALGLAGCSAKTVYRDSSQMCVAHGGAYSSPTQQCTFTAGTVVSAQKACQDQGGTYLLELQRCQFDD
jgi:putative hemolysin